MDFEGLTDRQIEVLRLRHEHGATLDQIASWLRISRRAVLYRLQCARKRTRGEEGLKPPGELKPVAAKQRFRTRRYLASQLTAGPGGRTLPLDDL